MLCYLLTLRLKSAYNFSMKSTIKQQGLSEQEFFQNISKGIPSPEIVLNEISEFISALQDAFDDSHSRCKDFLSDNGTVPKANRQFYPQMMRFLVHNYLDADGVKNRLVDENDAPINEVEGEREKEWKPSVLASNGIAGKIRGYNYRVLKAVKYRMLKGQLVESKRLEDLLPPPGSYDPENPKCKFYCQSHLKAYQQYLILPEDYKIPILKPNLIFVWDIEGFIKLYLAIPKSGNGRQASIYSMVEIKHPAEMIKPNGQTVSNEILETGVSGTEKNTNDEGAGSLRQSN